MVFSPSQANRLTARSMSSEPPALKTLCHTLAPATAATMNTSTRGPIARIGLGRKARMRNVPEIFVSSQSLAAWPQVKLSLRATPIAEMVANSRT